MPEKNGARFFPIFIDLKGKRILVIGGGRIAERRVRTLLLFADETEVIAPSFTEGLLALAAEDPGLRLVKKEYSTEDLEGAYMVLSCTDRKELNYRISSECRERGILVNNCADKRDCDFYFPGIAAKGSVVAGVSASGENHGKAAEITKKIRAVLEECL